MKEIAALSEKIAQNTVVAPPEAGQRAEPELPSPEGDGPTPFREQNQVLWSLIETEKKRRRHTNAEVAKELGLGTAYLSSLQSGTRAFSTVATKYIVALSRYIKQPLINILLLSGAVRITDLFVEEPPERVAQRAYEVLSADPLFGGWLPTPGRFESYPLDARMLIAALVLREQHLAWDSVAEALRAVNEMAKHGDEEEAQEVLGED